MGLGMLSLPTSCLALYCLVCYNVKQLPPPWKELLHHDGLEKHILASWAVPVRSVIVAMPKQTINWQSKGGHRNTSTWSDWLHRPQNVTGPFLPTTNILIQEDFHRVPSKVRGPCAQSWLGLSLQSRVFCHPHVCRLTTLVSLRQWACSVPHVPSPKDQELYLVYSRCSLNVRWLENFWNKNKCVSDKWYMVLANQGWSD